MKNHRLRGEARQATRTKNLRGVLFLRDCLRLQVFIPERLFAITGEHKRYERRQLDGGHSACSTVNPYSCRYIENNRYTVQRPLLYIYIHIQIERDCLRFSGGYCWFREGLRGGQPDRHRCVHQRKGSWTLMDLSWILY